jgi:pimeloyl-ACP methyl ester carboxylesterase
MWAAQVEALSPLGTVLALDLPGFGETPLAEPSLDVWARDVAASLRARGFEKVVLAGCSMGGYVALACMRVVPELLGGIALVDSRVSADTKEQRAARFAVIERVKREGVEPWAREFVGLALSPWTLEHKPAVAEQALTIMLSQRAESVIAAQRALADRPDSSEVWRNDEHDIERLIVHGTDDKIAPLDEAVALSTTYPSDFVAVRNAGHYSPLEQPKDVTKAISALWYRCGQF